MEFTGGDRDGPVATARPFGTTSVLLAALPSLLFLAGGVVTYFVPHMTPPLYIAGSVFMFTNSVVARPGSKQPRPVRMAFFSVALRLLAVAGFVVAAFWYGYLM